MKYRMKTLELQSSFNLYSKEFKKYQYRAAAFSGVRSFSGLASGGTRVCAVFACTGDTKDTCGKRFETYEANSTAIFEELTITGRTPTPIRTELDADDSIIYPVSMGVSILPLESKDYSYEKTVEENITQHIMTLRNSDVELYTFGLWGRVFETDGQEPHAPVKDSSTVQMLSRSLLMSVLILLFGNMF